MNAETPQGLSKHTAEQRLKTEGANELGTDQRRTLFDIVFEVVREPMFLLLLGAGAIYLAMGDAHEALILLGFVIIIMAITILQERRTENALQALRDIASPRALVIRDGETLRIAGRDVVRDDIMILSEGDRVAADGDVLQAHELAADESMLTGESDVVVKFASSEQPEKNKIFAGTLIVRGQGVVRVTATGSKTELGKIGKSLQEITLESSPLRDEIGRLTKRLAIIAIALSAILTLLYWFLRGNWLDSLLAGITLAMSLLPQEFAVILIVFFALGARRIAKHGVLTRRLNAIETLGETTVLCVDKTGTLTENRMAITSLCVDRKILDVEKIKTGELSEHYHELLEYLVLASEIEPHDPMEKAFHGFAREHLTDSDKLHPEWSLVREYELSPELLAMSHLWQKPSDADEKRDKVATHDIVATKGAPEAIAELCHLNDEQRQQLNRNAETMADRGLRVLAVAKAKHDSEKNWPDIQHDFTFEFIGLVGLADPLRAEVPGAIAECLRAGIRIVMITGDHPRTAKAIAASAGIISNEVMTGAQLVDLDNVTQKKHIASVNIFARVTPQQKLTIVEALKANGEVVAMTGDGVNDAPALKSAHIGIAMGKRGTDVAREAASLVLLDDNFTAIVAAIKLGRRIFANLRQAMVYTLAVHIPIIGLSVLPLLFGMPLLLTPIHIAFLELIIDPACSIVFEAEKADENIMQQAPRSANESLITTQHLFLSLLQGSLVMLATAGFYFWLLTANTPVAEARTLAFIVLITGNAVLIFPSRSAQTDWRILFTGLSRISLWVLGLTTLALVAITSIPAIASIFRFSPPPLQYWLLAFTFGMGLLLFFQGVKMMMKKRINVFDDSDQTQTR
jgi:Ca2+-transporting ATPase